MDSREMNKLSEKMQMLTPSLSKKAFRSEMENIDIKTVRNSQAWNGKPRNEKLSEIKCKKMTRWH